MLLKLILFHILYLRCIGARLGISGGSPTKDYEFAAVVSLWKNGVFNCGGSILNKNFILTAAHCVCTAKGKPFPPEYQSIRYGVRDISGEPPNEIRVKQVHCNAYYREMGTFDIAILELAESLPDNEKWKPVVIAKEFADHFDENGVIVGWGKTASNESISEQLLKLQAKIFNDDLCEKNNYIIEHNICLGAHNGSACQGDSGGPLIIDGILVGIASYIDKLECENAPNDKITMIYSRVKTYFDWITSIAGKVNYI